MEVEDAEFFHNWYSIHRSRGLPKRRGNLLQNLRAISESPINLQSPIAREEFNDAKFDQNPSLEVDKRKVSSFFGSPIDFEKDLIGDKKEDIVMSLGIQNNSIAWTTGLVTPVTLCPKSGTEINKNGSPSSIERLNLYPKLSCQKISARVLFSPKKEQGALGEDDSKIEPRMKDPLSNVPMVFDAPNEDAEFKCKTYTIKNNLECVSSNSISCKKEEDELNGITGVKKRFSKVFCPKKTSSPFIDSKRRCIDEDILVEIKSINQDCLDLICSPIKNDRFERNIDLLTEEGSIVEDKCFQKTVDSTSSVCGLPDVFEEVRQNNPIGCMKMDDSNPGNTWHINEKSTINNSNSKNVENAPILTEVIENFSDGISKILKRKRPSKFIYPTDEDSDDSEVLRKSFKLDCVHVDQNVSEQSIVKPNLTELQKGFFPLSSIVEKDEISISKVKSSNINDSIHAKSFNMPKPKEIDKCRSISIFKDACDSFKSDTLYKKELNSCDEEFFNMIGDTDDWDLPVDDNLASHSNYDNEVINNCSNEIKYLKNNLEEINKSVSIRKTSPKECPVSAHPAILSSENNELSMKPTHIGFTTGAGKQIKINESCLERAKKMLEEEPINLELSLKNESSKNPSFGVCESMAGGIEDMDDQSLYKPDLTQPELDLREEKLYKANLSKFAGFTTGEGKTITIDKKSLENAEKLLAEDEAEIRSKSMSIDHEYTTSNDSSKSKELKFAGFTSGGGKTITIDEKSLKNAKKLLAEDETETESTSMSINRECTTLNDSSKLKQLRYDGFTTGAGKTITIDKKSLDNAKKLLDEDEMETEGTSMSINRECTTLNDSSKLKQLRFDGFTTGVGKTITIDKKSLINARKLLVEDEMEMKSTSMPINPQNDTALSNSSKFKEFNFDGFCNGMGRKINISESLLKAKALLSECNGDTKPELKKFSSKEQDLSRSSIIKNPDVDTSFKSNLRESYIPSKVQSNSTDEPGNVNNSGNGSSNIVRNPAYDASISVKDDDKTIEEMECKTMIHFGERSPIFHSQILNRSNAKSIPLESCKKLDFEVSSMLGQEDDLKKTSSVEELEDSVKDQKAFVPEISVNNSPRINRYPACATRGNISRKCTPLHAKQNPGHNGEAIGDLEINNITEAFLLDDSWENSGTNIIENSLDSDEELVYAKELEENRKALRMWQGISVKDKDKEKIKHFDGRLMNKKRFGDRIDLFSLKLSKSRAGNDPLFDINLQNAESFSFTLGDSDQIRFDAGDGCLIIPNKYNCVGVEEIKQAFLASTVVDPRLIPTNWFHNHYRLVVWKLASIERRLGSQLKQCEFLFEQVSQQLKYRYDIELIYGRRPVLRKISEQDDIPQKTMILCISSIENKAANTYIKLTDGWYIVGCEIDSAMIGLIKKKKVRVGSKLIIHGAEFVGNPEPCHPLNLKTSLLHIHSNMTRLVPWYWKLGRIFKYEVPSPTPLICILPDGGVVGMIRIKLIHKYPLIYMDKSTNSTKFLNRQMNERNRRTIESEKDRIFYEVLQQVQNELSRDCVRNAKRTTDYNAYNIKSLQDGEEILRLVEDSTDPSSLQNLLSEGQMQLARLWKARVDEERSRRIQLEVKRRVGNEFKLSTTIPMLKLGVLDSKMDTAFITIWRPNEELISMLVEGKSYDVYYLTASSPRNGYRQLTAGKNTRWDFCSNVIHTKCQGGERSASNLKTMDGEFMGNVDLVGIVIKIFDRENYHQDVYLSDHEKNFVILRFQPKISEFRVKDSIKVGSFIGVLNLSIGKCEKFLQICNVTAHTLFMSSNLPEFMQRSLKKMRECIKDMTSFLEEINDSLDERNSQILFADGHSKSLHCNPLDENRSLSPKLKTKIRKMEIKQKIEFLGQNMSNPSPLRALGSANSPFLKKPFRNPLRKSTE